MKQIILFAFSFAGFLIFQNACFGQQVLSSSGGDHAAGSLSISWTIGEPIIETIGEALVLTQGFHQTKLTVTSVYEYRKKNIEFSVFPNPVLYELNVKAECEPEDFQVTILDNLGVVIFSKTLRLSQEVTKLNFDKYTPGIYYVRIQNKKSLVLQTFKVVKSN